MNNDKIKPYGINQVNWKILVLIAIVILVGVSLAAIQEYKNSQSQRTYPIDPLSEAGKSLTNIAEKALENESIDPKYLHIHRITRDSSNTIMLRFSGTKTFNNAKIYTNHNMTNKEISTVFAADLARYDIATYFTKDKQVKVYDKNARVESEIWEYGKNYSININNNTLEVIDKTSNKVKLKILNYMSIQNEEQTNTRINEINKKFEMAQQKTPIEFYIDKGEPIIIIDTIDSSSSAGDLFVDVAFYNSQLSAIHIQETTKEEKQNGWGGSKVVHKTKYFNTS